MRPQEREILTRFYLQGEPVETIQVEMGLSEAECQVLKSRAKAACLAVFSKASGRVPAPSGHRSFATASARARMKATSSACAERHPSQPARCTVIASVSWGESLPK
jgi:hypothetical protein